MVFDLKDNLKNKAYALAGTLFVCGAVIGAVSTALYIDSRDKNERAKVDGQSVIEEVKALLAQDGEIEGSWIELQPLKKERYGQEQVLYFGGVSRQEKGHLVQYEFIADAQSGQIIDLYQV
ncbi:hypothetical protein ACWOE5_03420 [Aerococcus sanguinicola]|uniref:PepSY domain-containing protein n=1 Tax=Aerococcus sanguinicola TaxID=119206 RepID=A0A0X8FC88_9LACT|nr:MULTISPECIES: hypothetical protein [Aerococcus]AMB94474.1 hypothetical protein AWM72_06795 [Aerococcus sanguinicola]KAB0645914.1 hypothetical protein F6I01_09260 [Aerococcus sanguinicola]MDK6234183.1 hypothetical protein [Aerococcus sp. UMB10185]MDK6805053.1 hypothetical protein [Aerococcus sp. UMB7834]MDK6856225.1 hypothetical protein [Aerococcus sp. UMB7533]